MQKFLYSQYNKPAIHSNKAARPITLVSTAGVNQVKVRPKIIEMFPTVVHFPSIFAYFCFHINISILTWMIYINILLQVHAVESPTIQIDIMSKIVDAFLVFISVPWTNAKVCYPLGLASLSTTCGFHKVHRASLAAQTEGLGWCNSPKYSSRCLLYSWTVTRALTR